jgi:hypothetical protein
MSIQLVQVLIGLAVGIGLAAATGLRVFVPLLGVSIAAITGHLPLAAGFHWLGTWPALAAFAAATVVEIAAFYVPWLDHALDAIAAPAAVAAGTLLTVSLLGDATPFLRWTLGIIAGGGVAGIVQAGSMLARGASTATTGGLGNHLVSTLEFVGSVVLTVVALLLPLLCVIVVIALLAWAIKGIAGSRAGALSEETG